MAQKPVEPGLSEVPKKIFEQLIAELGPAGVAEDVVARLRAVLLEKNTLTESAIREALYPIIEDL